MTTTQKIQNIIKTNLDMDVIVTSPFNDIAITFVNMNDVLRFKASSFVNEVFNKAFKPDGEDLEEELAPTLFYRA